MSAPLRLRQHVRASPLTVFRAWIVPERMRLWLFASDRGEIIRVETDPVVGGRFSILERNEGWRSTTSAATWSSTRPAAVVHPRGPGALPGVNPDRSRVCPDDQGCAVEFTQTGIDPEKTRSFWEQMLTQLAQVATEHYPKGASADRSGGHR